MTVIAVEHDVAWIPRPNCAVTVLSAEMPPRVQVTSALALAFQDNQILMTHLSQRDWDIPGGRIELGESPEETVHREVMEETGATLQEIHLFAHQQISLLGEVPANYRYPTPVSYQLIYLCKIGLLGCFTPTDESLAVSLFLPDHAFRTAWVRDNRALLEAALRELR